MGKRGDTDSGEAGSHGESLVGSVLGGFKLLDLLGEGGQAVVYRGDGMVSRDGDVAQPCAAAVKVVRRSRGDEATVLRFLRELALASRLIHPYAASLYGYGASHERLWMAMEFIQGESLATFAHSTPPTKDVVTLLSRVCEVVDAAHKRGIVHRDIKPANVMVLPGLVPKLLDFGIAKEVSAAEPEPALQPQVKRRGYSSGSIHAQLTGAGAAVGTPAYMAPESWVAPTNVGPQADIYALGVMAYELFEGVRPYRRPTIPELMNAHLYAALPALERHPETAQAIHWAMAKSPNARPSTALAFAKALEEALR